MLAHILGKFSRILPRERSGIEVLFSCFIVSGFFIFVIAFNLIRSCMEQIEMLCGFNRTLAYISAIFLIPDRSCTLTLSLLLVT